MFDDRTKKSYKCDYCTDCSEVLQAVAGTKQSDI